MLVLDYVNIRAKFQKNLMLNLIYKIWAYLIDIEINLRTTVIFYSYIMFNTLGIQ